jgi:hypothetical protein
VETESSISMAQDGWLRLLTRHVATIAIGRQHYTVVRCGNFCGSEYL